MKTNSGHGVLPIYIQHSSVILMKSLAKQFNKEQMHVMASYRQGSDGGQFTIFNADFLKSNQIVLPSVVLDCVQFNELIHQIKSNHFLKDHPSLLCADANLGYPNSVSVSEPFHALVQAIQPTVLVPFSETPLCVADAVTYLSGKRTTEGYQASSVYEWSHASNQAGVAGIIQNALDNLVLNRPEIAIQKKSSFDSLLSFFRCHRSAQVGVTYFNQAEQDIFDKQVTKNRSSTESITSLK